MKHRRAIQLPLSGILLAIWFTLVYGIWNRTVPLVATATMDVPAGWVCLGVMPNRWLILRPIPASDFEQEILGPFRVWDCARREPVRDLGDAESALLAIHTGARNRLAYKTGRTISISDLNNGRRLFEDADLPFVDSLSLTSGGRFAVFTHTLRVRRFDLDHGAWDWIRDVGYLSPVAAFYRQERNVLSADGNVAIIPPYDGSGLWVVDYRTRARLWQLPDWASQTNCQFSADATQVMCVVDISPTIIRFDARSGARLGLLPADDHPSDANACWDGDGRYVLQRTWSSSQILLSWLHRHFRIPAAVDVWLTPLRAKPRISLLEARSGESIGHIEVSATRLRGFPNSEPTDTDGFVSIDDQGIAIQETGQAIQYFTVPPARAWGTLLLWEMLPVLAGYGFLKTFKRLRNRQHKNVPSSLRENRTIA